MAGGSWVWNCINVKALSFVPDDKRDSITLAATTDIDSLPRILLISVDDGICQRLAQCDFNFSLDSQRISASFDEVHEAVGEGGNRGDFASHREFHLDG